MTSAVETLLQRGDKLHSDKVSLNSLHQEIADNFYPERADFTRQRYLGADFASNLTSSYPIIVRREGGNAISSILRPSGIDWFEPTTHNAESLRKPSKMWLEHKGKIQRRAMYDRMTGFVRATKEGDHDFFTFGQTVISIDFDPKTVALLYRTWHLRDCAWTEGYNGAVNEMHINWQPTARDLRNWFGADALHETVKRLLEQEPNRRIQCRRVILPAEDYAIGKNWRHPWVSVYIDRENKHVLQEMDMRTKGHIIPRWQTVAGSQYAYSPATVAGLPDARLIQAMTLTLLEAGEMAVHPPYLASGDYIREDIQNFAGGVTWVDGEYDKRKVDVLRRLDDGRSALPFGMDFREGVHEMLAAAFYLNKLTLPPADREMTAYETSERIKEYIRSARPLFEPMEHEYNYELCDMTFDILMNNGAFGSVHDMPPELRGKDVQWRFESPLHEMIERQKGVTFLEAKQLVREAFDLDQSAGLVFDARTALREALEGVQSPAAWIRDQREVEQMASEEAAEQQIRQKTATVAQAADAAKTLREGIAA